nr:hypothetical protein [Clostridium sp.]
MYKGYTGWAYKGNDWYYVDTNGTFTTGWLTMDNYTYYSNSDGNMVTGAYTIDGKSYYFSNDSDGHREHLVTHRVSSF